MQGFQAAPILIETLRVASKLLRQEAHISAFVEVCDL